MMTPLSVVVLIMATAMIWLLRQTVNVKPWTEEGPLEGAASGISFRRPPATVALGVFLAVATSLFVLTICAYFMRMMAADWRTLIFPGVLWLNTGLLAASDVAMHSARTAVRQGRLERTRTGLAAGGVASFGFLAGQVWAWLQLNSSGYFASDPGSAGAVSAGPANSFFYLFTALHGVHVLGGLWVWGRTTARAWRGGQETARIRLSVELCALYWHYLLVVWLVLLALLVPAVSELCRGHLSF